MIETTHSATIARGIRPEVARRRIAAFRKRFGQPHLYFAQHAAFPLALTPDLLYRLWANFQRNIHDEQLKIPWVAVADVLLSPLCREIDSELYEMDIAIRTELLDDLKTNLDFGQKRIYELSSFLLDYVQQQLGSNDPDILDLAQAQQWTALAYTQPSKVAGELFDTLLDQRDKLGQVRVVSLMETLDTLAEPLAALEGFVPLLTYAQGVGYQARGKVEEANAWFRAVVATKGTEQTEQVFGKRLPLPEQLEAEPVQKVVLDRPHPQEVLPQEAEAPAESKSEEAPHEQSAAAVSSSSMTDEQVIYLSPDDDLTSVRERLEQVQARSITLIVPSNNQLHSLVSWRLLHSFARKLDKNVLVISSDNQIRVVAREAGFRIVAPPAVEPPDRQDFEYSVNTYPSIQPVVPQNEEDKELDALLQLEDIKAAQRIREAARQVDASATAPPLDARLLSAEQWREEGDTHYDAGRYNEALVAYEQAIHLDPNNPQINYALGRTYYTLGNYNTAIEALEASHPEETIDQANVQKELGLAYRRRGAELKSDTDYDKAIESLKRAASLNSDDSDTLAILGGLYRRREEYLQARDFYERAWRIDPNSSYILGNLASLSWYLGNLKDARMYFAYAEIAATVSIKKGQSEAYWDYYDLALAQLALGKTNEAKETYQLAVQQTPGKIQFDAVLDNLYFLQKAPDPIPGLDEVARTLEEARGRSKEY